MNAASRLLTALFALVACLALAACGSSSGGKHSVSGKSAADVLKETFGPDHAIKSGNVNLTLAVNSQGTSAVSGPVNLTVTGPFQSQGNGKVPQFALKASLGAAGQQLQAGATSTGTKGYVQVADRTFDVGDSFYKTFASGYGKADKEAGGTKSTSPTLSALGIHPEAWLTNPRTAGDEEVGGVKAVHVTSGVDVPKLVADVSTLLKKGSSLGVATAQTQQFAQGLTAAQQQAAQDAIKSAAIDVWAGKDDGTLRRLRTQLSFSVPADQRADLGGLQGGTLTLDLSFSGLNEKQTITAPKGARPVSELKAEFSQLAGGLTGGSSSTTGSSGSSSSSVPSTAGSQKYLDCLQKAGQDLSKVSQCASLIGG